jgi:excisionase family DNA binding protein
LRDEQPDLLTSTQVAAIFNVSIKTVSRWSKLGLLPSIKTPGGRLRFRRSDVDEFLRQQDQG